MRHHLLAAALVALLPLAPAAAQQPAPPPLAAPLPTLAPFDSVAEPPSVVPAVVGPSIVVNVPAGTVDLLIDGVRVGRWPASVGRSGYRTPTGSYEISSIIWNPTWTPPDSPWARGRRHTAPGPRNPMGRVKMQLEGLIYLHGTVEVATLGTPASHGCIRLANEAVMDLARRLQEHVGTTSSPERLAALEANSRQTGTVRLIEPIPVAVVYETVVLTPDARRAWVHRDIYARTGLTPAARLRRAVEATGQTLAVDDDTLARTIREAGSEGIDLATLTTSVAASTQR